MWFDHSSYVTHLYSVADAVDGVGPLLEARVVVAGRRAHRHAALGHVQLQVRQCRTQLHRSGVKEEPFSNDIRKVFAFSALPLQTLLMIGH